MITGIHIENFALIKSQHFGPGSGLNIVTGETGAGKSLLAAAIAGIFGEDVSSDQILHGQSRLDIQCELELSPEKCGMIADMTGVEADDDIYVLSRTIQDKGKNSVRLNGSIISLSMLRQIGELVFDFHTQNETKQLLKKENQTRLLDQFCSPGFLKKLEEYNRVFNSDISSRDKLIRLMNDIRDKEARRDILNYQITEIEDTAPDEKTYNELRERKDLLINSEKIARSLGTITKLLSDDDVTGEDTAEKIRSAAREFGSLSGFYAQYSKIETDLEDIYWKIKDISENVKLRIQELEYDPLEIDEIISRIDAVDKLKKKYGDTISDIHKTLDEKKRELDELINSEISIAKLDETIAENRKKLTMLDEALLDERNKAAVRLSKNIVDELRDLDMPDVHFEVRFSKKNLKDREFALNGSHEARFAISTNKGQPLKNLDEISSGGEMARVMLVFKKLNSSFDDTDILVFDEIESGVSGSTAFKVGKKMYDISKTKQVICITHIPQIAVFADKHFKVFKVEKDGATYSVVENLDEEMKITEIGKLLGGYKVTENVVLNAQELLKLGKEYMEDRDES
jgi:DNA repair protein RecN (Recombination protein N)